MSSLKEPTNLIWDERLTEDDKEIVREFNISLDRLSSLRAVEISVSGKFAHSQIAGHLATYQQLLLHRLVALMDGAAIAWNNRCTLSAMLSARALMETLAVIAELVRKVGRLIEEKNLIGLYDLACNGIFASRDEDWLKMFQGNKATNAQTYIDKLDKLLEGAGAAGFRRTYDGLSECCHPNSMGHSLMFSELDLADETVRFFDEREGTLNGKMILIGLAPVKLVGSMLAHLDGLIEQVSDLQRATEADEARK
jgi:hypothetical protein